MSDTLNIEFTSPRQLQSNRYPEGIFSFPIRLDLQQPFNHVTPAEDSRRVTDAKVPLTNYVIQATLRDFKRTVLFQRIYHTNQLHHYNFHSF